MCEGMMVIGKLTAGDRSVALTSRIGCRSGTISRPPSADFLVSESVVLSDCARICSSRNFRTAVRTPVFESLIMPRIISLMAFIAAHSSCTVSRGRYRHGLRRKSVRSEVTQGGGDEGPIDRKRVDKSLDAVGRSEDGY